MAQDEKTLLSLWWGKTKKYLTAHKKSWQRALLMVFYYVFLAVYVCSGLIAVIGVLQFLLKLITGKTNSRLVTAGEHLSRHTWQIVRFILYSTESAPWPFGPGETIGGSRSASRPSRSGSSSPRG